MNSPDILSAITPAFPFLKNAADEIKKELSAHASFARIPKGGIIFLEGDECKHLALIIAGTVRVYKPAESGREITLYRLGRGESCVLTASCIFSSGSFPAIAAAEDDIEAVLVPSPVFRGWINKYELWRNYIFDLLSRRLAEIITTVEEVAFRRMDIRIAEHILRLTPSHSSEIHTTHQDIALELGTSREVVSRILKHFEAEHLLSIGRGTIIVNDRKGLSKRAGQAIS